MPETWARLARLWAQLGDPRVMDRIFDASRWGLADYLAFQLMLVVCSAYSIRALVGLAQLAGLCWREHKYWLKSIERRRADIKRRREDLARRKAELEEWFQR